MAIGVDRERELLEANQQRVEEALWGLRRERRTFEEMLARATASKLRAGKYMPKGDQGQAATAARQRLAQLEYDIECNEILLEGIERDLAALPKEEAE